MSAPSAPPPAEPMIALDALVARAAPLALQPITAALGAGAHALLGTREDGAGLLLAAIAGEARARSGRVRVLGGRPGHRAVARALAYVPREPALPEVLQVGEALAMAAEVRGETARDPVERLAALGIAELAPRAVRSLAPDEARAVALCEALTSGARVVLLDEPLTVLDPRAAARVPALARARAAEGACVVIATASLRDAAELADVHLVLERGALVKRASALGDLLAPAGARARVHAVTSDPRALLAALAAESAPASLEADARAVAVTGDDPIALAEAVARAAVRAGVDLDELRVEPATLEELRASLAGDAAGAYQAAQERARAMAIAEERRAGVYVEDDAGGPR